LRGMLVRCGCGVHACVPAVEDVIADCLWIGRDLKMRTGTGKEPAVVGGSDVLARRVGEVWIRVVKCGLEHLFPLWERLVLCRLFALIVTAAV
jgi:hypothetical protein